jgi:negative regulator of sigma E activity
MINETIYALVDGECSDEALNRLLDTLDQDCTAGHTMSRHFLAHDLLQGVQVRAPADSISAAVMAAVHAAPVGLPRLSSDALPRPSNGTVLPTARSPNQAVLPVDKRHVRRRVRPSWMGWAAAASVGALAMLGATQFMRSGQNAAIAAADSAVDRDVAEVWAGDDLDRYLIEHSNASGRMGGNVLSYARFAAYDAIQDAGWTADR